MDDGRRVSAGGSMAVRTNQSMLDYGLGTIMPKRLLPVVSAFQRTRETPYAQRSVAMAVALASEEQMLLDMVRELVSEKVAPRAAEIDAKGVFPWDMKELLAKQDILAMPFPEEYGGLGASELSILMTIE